MLIRKIFKTHSLIFRAEENSVGLFFSFVNICYFALKENFFDEFQILVKTVNFILSQLPKICASKILWNYSIFELQFWIEVVIINRYISFIQWSNIAVAWFLTQMFSTAYTFFPARREVWARETDCPGPGLLKGPDEFQKNINSLSLAC